MKQFAPAKINLYLHILGRRPDGFHELETLMVPISLGGRLELDIIPSGIEFTCTDATLSDAADNLATKAARLFLEEFSLIAGVRIHLEKQVPVGAGLGGGAATPPPCSWPCANSPASPAPTKNWPNSQLTSEAKEAYEQNSAPDHARSGVETRIRKKSQHYYFGDKRFSSALGSRP